MCFASNLPYTISMHGYISVLIYYKSIRDTLDPVPVVHLAQRFNTSWRLPSRHPYGEIGFLESDYLVSRLKQALPDDDLRVPLKGLKGLDASVVERLGEDLTVDEVLTMGLEAWRRKSGLSLQGAVKFRDNVIGRQSATT